MDTSPKEIVLKFGGTSQSIKNYPNILKNIKYYYDQGYNVTVVLSAIQKTTNDLYSLMNAKTITEYLEIKSKIIKTHDSIIENLNLFNTKKDYKSEEYKKLEESKKDYSSDKYLYEILESYLCGKKNLEDKIKLIGSGEFMSSNILASYLIKNGIDSMYNSTELYIKSNIEFSKIDHKTLSIKGKYKFLDNIFHKARESYIKSLNNKKSNIRLPVCIVSGFTLYSSDFKPVLFSRSGSDTTASLIASGIKAKKCIISTDVDGIYTANPSIIPDAKLIPEIEYRIAQELSAMGSSVIHLKSIQPCAKKNIEIVIQNTKTLKQGTIIKSCASNSPIEEEKKK